MIVPDMPLLRATDATVSWLWHETEQPRLTQSRAILGAMILERTVSVTLDFRWFNVVATVVGTAIFLWSDDAQSKRSGDVRIRNMVTAMMRRWPFSVFVRLLLMSFLLGFTALLAVSETATIHVWLSVLDGLLLTLWCYWAQALEPEEPPRRRKREEEKARAKLMSQGVWA